MPRFFPQALTGFASLVLLLPLLSGCATADPESDPTAEEQPIERIDCQAVACVALTFDDGPSQYTAALLDELAAQQAPATFFVLGQNVPKYPQTLERMVADGHQIGSHGYAHKDITTLTREGIEHEVQWTNDAVTEASGVIPTVFRPPYGANGAVYNRLIPTPLLLWDVDTLDWLHHDPEQTVQTALDNVQSGSVILLHDIHQTSVAAVGQLVRELRALGYTLVTVEDLFAQVPFEAGAVYSKLTTDATTRAGELGTPRD